MKDERGKRMPGDLRGGQSNSRYASLRDETNELVAILVTMAKKVKARAL